MRFLSRGRGELTVDVTPLIDIVFQLLLFFMVTTTFVTSPAIEVDLPEASSSGMLKDRDDLEVEISLEDGIRLDNELISLDSLAEAFAQTAARAPGAMVIIHADQAVGHGEVVQVMDLARGAGLQRLGIATEPHQGTGGQGTEQREP